MALSGRAAGEGGLALVTIEPVSLKASIRAEISEISDSRVRKHIEGFLVEPKPLMRAWDYGAPGEKYLCWTVLEHPKSGSAVAYCEQGFGPRSPWGLVKIRANEGSMGMDAGWFSTLAEAIFDSLVLTDLSIWRAFKEVSGSKIALSDECGWDETWKKVMALREMDLLGRYDCDNDEWIRLRSR